MAEEMLTLEKFEEASETVKKVTQETKLVYSDYFSAATGNKVYLKPENMQYDRGRTFPGTDHRFGRQPCPGRCLCGTVLRSKSRDRYADHDTADQSGADKELRRRSCAVWKCV